MTEQSFAPTRAAAFKRFGFDIDKIAEGTGLSRKEIEKLQLGLTYFKL